VVLTGTATGSDALVRAAAGLAWRLPCGDARGAPLAIAQPEANTLGLAMMGGGTLQEVLARTAGWAPGEGALVVLQNDLDRRLLPAESEALLGRGAVVVLDHLEGPTTGRAHVVLPAAAWAEQTGTFVSAEGRAQRFFQVFVPDEGIRESWRWLRDLRRAMSGDAAAGWATHDELLAELAAELPQFAAVPAAAPGAPGDRGGLPVARKSRRYSGRTAMLAHLSVQEPRPPDDPDSGLVFSQEGLDGFQAPEPLTPRYWAPGWNSSNSLNRFREEVDGPQRGGEEGVRLIEPGAAEPRAADAPAAAAPRAEGEWLVVPVQHLFGSDELSAAAPAVAARVPEPYVAVGEADAAGAFAGARVALLEWGGFRAQLPVRVLPGLQRGVAGLPVGLPGLTGVRPPLVARLTPWDDHGGAHA
jgi:NADH-quinone oxidoreductase subunit G